MRYSNTLITVCSKITFSVPCTHNGAKETVYVKLFWYTRMSMKWHQTKYFSNSNDREVKGGQNVYKADYKNINKLLHTQIVVLLIN